MNKKRKEYKKFSPYFMLFVVVAIILVVFGLGNDSYKQLNYDELLKEFQENKVTEVRVSERSGDRVIIVTGKLKDSKDNEYFTAQAPLTSSTYETIEQYRELNGFKYKVIKNSENSSWLVVLVNVVPIVLILGGCVLLFSRLNKTNKKQSNKVWSRK